MAKKKRSICKSLEDIKLCFEDNKLIFFKAHAEYNIALNIEEDIENEKNKTRETLLRIIVDSLYQSCLVNLAITVNDKEELSLMTTIGALEKYYDESGTEQEKEEWKRKAIEYKKLLNIKPLNSGEHGKPYIKFLIDRRNKTLAHRSIDNIKETHISEDFPLPRKYVNEIFDIVAKVINGISNDLLGYSIIARNGEIMQTNSLTAYMKIEKEYINQIEKEYKKFKKAQFNEL